MKQKFCTLYIQNISQFNFYIQKFADLFCRLFPSILLSHFTIHFCASHFLHYLFCIILVSILATFLSFRLNSYTFLFCSLIFVFDPHEIFTFILSLLLLDQIDACIISIAFSYICMSASFLQYNVHIRYNIVHSSIKFTLQKKKKKF